MNIGFTYMYVKWHLKVMLAEIWYLYKVFTLSSIEPKSLSWNPSSLYQYPASFSISIYIILLSLVGLFILLMGSCPHRDCPHRKMYRSSKSGEMGEAQLLIEDLWPGAKPTNGISVFGCMKWRNGTRSSRRRNPTSSGWIRRFMMPSKHQLIFQVSIHFCPHRTCPQHIIEKKGKAAGLVKASAHRRRNKREMKEARAEEAE